MIEKRLGFGAVVAMLALAGVLRGQEKPLTVDGTFVTGYYNTVTRGDANQSLNFVPLGARFDIDGYYKSPDLVNFWVEPEVNLGPQASEAGFQGGNGVRLRVTTLRKLIPLTFRYSNVQVEDVYFGGLSQVSGYTLKNRNKEIGLTLELKPTAKSPSLIVDWAQASVHSQSDITAISDYFSHGNHLNADSEYERWGWVMDGFFHYQKQTSELLAPIEGGTQFGSLVQSVTQYQGSARRSFGGDSEFYADGGAQSTSSLLFTLPVDLHTHYATASLRLFQKRKVRTMVRANYSSNLASQLLAQAAGSLATSGSIVPDQNVLLPFSHGISTFNVTNLTNVDLPAGFGAFLSLERNSILSNDQSVLGTGYFSASAGLTYAHKTNWGGFAGEYAREYGLGSITGQSGTIQGQNYRGSVQRGRSGGLQLDGMVHGYSQSVHNAQPLSNRQFSAEGNVSDHLFKDFSGRVGGGWQWGSIVNSANEFKTGGYIARAGIEHPRFQISASLNDTNSNSLPFYGNLLGGLGGAAILPVLLPVIPSDYRATNFSLHATPLHKVEFSAVYSHSRQHLDGTLSNDFELFNASLTYHYRRIQIEAGFDRFTQTFAQYPAMMRRRFYIRISRHVRLV
jgi:hypothetical protein